MTLAELVALLAGALKCAHTPEAVAASLPPLLERLEGEAKAAKTQHVALCSALGAQDHAGAVERIAAGVVERKSLTEALPILAEFYNRSVAGEDAAAEQDMGAVMATMAGLPEHLTQDASRGIFFSRTAGVDLEPIPLGPDGRPNAAIMLDAAKRAMLFGALQQRLDARESFRKKYLTGGGQQRQAGPQPPKHNSALFQRFYAPPSQQGGFDPMRGAQGNSPLDRISFGAGGQPILANAGPGTQMDGARLDLSDQGGIPGANEIERAMFIVKEKKMVADINDFDAVHAAACELARGARQATNGRASF